MKKGLKQLAEDLHTRIRWFKIPETREQGVELIGVRVKLGADDPPVAWVKAESFGKDRRAAVESLGRLIRGKVAVETGTDRELMLPDEIDPRQYR